MLRMQLIRTRLYFFTVRSSDLGINHSTTRTERERERGFGVQICASNAGIRFTSGMNSRLQWDYKFYFRHEFVPLLFRKFSHLQARPQKNGNQLNYHLGRGLSSTIIWEKGVIFCLLHWPYLVVLPADQGSDERRVQNQLASIRLAGIMLEMVRASHIIPQHARTVTGVFVSTLTIGLIYW